MTESEAYAEVRDFFEHRRIFLRNIQRARRHIYETKEEIIAGLSMQATDYSKDIVQSDGGEVMTGLVSRLPIEKRKAEYECSIQNAIVDGWESRLEWFDGQWLSLPAALHEVITLRYYDCMSVLEASLAVPCSDKTIKNNADKAFSIIAKNYCLQFPLDSTTMKDVIMDHEPVTARI